LVIDQRFEGKLPSILDGITAIFYEGGELTLTDGMKLLQALDEFAISYEPAVSRTPLYHPTVNS
jgi:hypothetical protein